MSILEIQESQIGSKIARITFSFFGFCFSSVQYIKECRLTQVDIVNLALTIGGKVQPVMSALFEMIIESWWGRYEIQLA